MEKDVVNFFKKKHGGFVYDNDKGYFYENTQRLFNSAVDNTKKESVNMRFEKKK